jgi:hypothetical protein
MSISLQNFVRTAGRDLTGDIRIAKGTEDTLVNKGTFGNQVASIFRNIGEALGLVQPDPTRAQRQQGAFDSFKASLEEHYGSEITARALESVGLGDGGRLTGGRVLQAISSAKAEIAINRQVLVQQQRDFVPGMPGFDDIARSLDPQVVLDNFPQEARVEYNQRLTERLRSDSRNGTLQLTQEQVQTAARDTLKQVSKLVREDALDGASQARTNLTTAFRDILIALGEGRSAQTLMPRLERAVANLHELMVAELKGEYGRDEMTDAMDQALQRAMRQLGARDPGLLFEAQKNALKEDSPLRGIMSAAYKITSNAEGSGSQLSLSNRLFSTGVQVIATLSGGISARTGGSVGDDLDVLTDERSVSPRTLEEGRRVMQTVMDRIPVGKGVGDKFLTEIARDFTTHDDTGNPDWNTPVVLQRLEQAVLEHSVSDSLNLREAVANFREALEGNETLHPGLLAKLSAGLDAMEAAYGMVEISHDIGAFNRVSPTDQWRMFGVGRLQDEGLDKWDMEHRGEGSLGGMQRAFTYMLSTHRDGVPLTAGLVEQYHRDGSEDTYIGGMLGLSYKEGVSEEDQVDFREMSRTPPGFRSKETNLNLRIGTETTEAGRQELLELAGQDPWFQSMSNGEIAGEFGIAYTGKTAEETRERTQQILDRYQHDIQGAMSDHEKLTVIGRAVQDLYRSHVFEDGNTRTTVFTVMNRMLLDNGLSPSILQEPKAAAGFSGPEFVQHMREGQQRFQDLKT